MNDITVQGRLCLLRKKEIRIECPFWIWDKKTEEKMNDSYSYR